MEEKAQDEAKRITPEIILKTEEGICLANIETTTEAMTILSKIKLRNER